MKTTAHQRFDGIDCTIGIIVGLSALAYFIISIHSGRPWTHFIDPIFMMVVPGGIGSIAMCASRGIRKIFAKSGSK